MRNDHSESPGSDLASFAPTSRPGMTKNVEICMADVLVQLIDECVTIPSDVLDILLANFTSKAAVSSIPLHLHLRILFHSDIDVFIFLMTSARKTTQLPMRSPSRSATLLETDSRNTSLR